MPNSKTSVGQQKAPKREIIIKGVPSDLGANMRGSNIGPAAVRIANLKQNIADIGYSVSDHGDFLVPIRDELSDAIKDEKFLQPIIKLCSDIAEESYQIMKAEQIPLLIGGDHSLAIGSVSGISRYYHEKNQNFGMIWIDAHADINTPNSSDSGNIHGMPLATLLGLGHPELISLGYKGPKINPKKVALLAIRTLDQREKEILKSSGISYYSMREIDERGIFVVMQEVLQNLTKDTDGLHLSFDLDGVDPLYAPGVSTPVPGGLSYREAHLLLEMLAETQSLRSMEFVELNPFVDVSAQSTKLAIDLILSALGKSII